MALVFLAALPRLGSLKRGMVTDRILYWALLVFALHFLPRTLLVIVSNGSLDGFGTSPFWVILQIVMPLFGMVLALSLLATSAADTIADLRREKDTDPLTGLLNRRGFDATAERVIGTSRGGLFSLIVCDIDHFKSINDTYGHRGGDNVLRSVATILREASRGGDVVARIGGEEFVVLLLETDAAEARVFAERLREDLERARFTAVAPGRSVTASFGIAQRREEETVWDVVSRADRALYAAKNAGRNRSLIDGVETFSPGGYDSAAAAYRRAR
jgi:diguanylate cyclase (GGDEF)-like protein